jgi:hypothetical protein
MKVRVDAGVVLATDGNGRQARFSKLVESGNLFIPPGVLASALPI